MRTETLATVIWGVIICGAIMVYLAYLAKEERECKARGGVYSSRIEVCFSPESVKGKP